MALFKILKGNEANLPAEKHEGWAYVTEKGNMYVDLSNDKRVKIGNRADSAEFADKATGDTKPIRDIYLAKLAQVESTGSKFTFRGITGGGDNAPDLISIPLAGDLAGLISNAAQTIKGIKTFANGIAFPDVSSTTYPATSQGLSWTGSTDGAKIYYEVQASDKGMLIVESRDDTNAGAIFRNSSSKKEVSIIDGLVTGSFKGNLSGTASHATSDADGNNIAATYVASVVAQSDNKTVRVTKGDGTYNDVQLHFAGSSSFGGAANSANILNGHSEKSVTGRGGDGKLRYIYNVSNGTAGLFGVNNNANAIITLSKHAGNYDSQLGFSSNGKIYYRSFNGGALDTTTTWKQIAFIDTVVDKATQAEKDWVGQVIDETYMKYPLTISGETITMTRGDGVNGTITVPDQKVTQSETTTTSYRPVILGATYSATVADLTKTIRDQVYVSTKFYANPSQGIFVAPTFKGDLDGNAKTATNATYSEKDKEGNIIADTYIATLKQDTSNGTTFSFKGVSAGGDNRPDVISIPAANATVAGLVTNATQTFAGVKTFKNNIDVKGKVIIDLNGNKVEIGSDNKSYFHFLVRSQATTPLTFWFGGPIQTAGNITPYGHDTYDLGSSGSRWKTGYFGSGGINVSGTITDKDANELRAKLFVSTLYANTLTGSSFIIGGKNTAGDEITSLTIPNASTTSIGLITTGAQTLAGNKTFTGDIYISHATTADMAYNTTNPKLVFSENGGQPVGIVYTDYDTYRSPAGLKIMSTVSNNGAAWLEVEGDLFVKGHIYDKNGDTLLADRYVASFYSHTSTASTFKLGGKNYDGDVICNHQIPNASTTVAGLITAEAQDLKGNKTLDGTFYGKANYHRFTAGQAIHRTYMPSGQGRAKGWYRIAKISGLENYAVFTLFITGGYHYGSPAVAQMHITLMHRTVRIRQMSGIAGLISKIRITGNQDAWYLEVYQNQTYAASETMGNQLFYLVGDVNAELYQPTTANGAAGELTIECPIRTYDNTYVNAGTANRMAYYSATGDISSTGHYASTTQIGINMTNTTTIGSNSLYVEGTSKFNGDLTVVGNAIITKDIRMNTGGTAIYWDAGDYRQRILNTDDSTNNTDVFTFQQSSDSGSTWRDLLKIQDDGVLIVTDNTGQFRKNYASANTTPAILIGSKNQDISIWRVYSSDATYKATGVYGYSLKYRGTQSGQNNYLTLYADAQTAASQVIAYSIDQAGNMSIRTEVDMNYSLFVNGTTKIKFRNDREIPWVSTANLNIGQSAGTLHITTNSHGSGTAIQNGNEASITFGTGDLAYAGIYSPTSGGFGNHLIFATTNSYDSGAYARMIIKNDGNVGIGTMTPGSYKLYVNGTSYFANTVVFNKSITYNPETANRLMWTDGNKVVKAANHYANATKVAINYCDAEPTENLHVGGTSRFTNTIRLESHNKVGLIFRQGTGYDTTLSYQTDGNEAMVFATKNAVTSFIFVNGEDSATNMAANRWRSLTPALQIKQNSVYIGSLVNSGTTPGYKFFVNGTTYLQGETRVSTKFTANYATKTPFTTNGNLYFVNKAVSWDTNSYIQHVILLIPVPTTTNWYGMNYLDGKFLCWKQGGNVYDVVEINMNCVYNSLRYHLKAHGDHAEGWKLCIVKYGGVSYYALNCPYHANPYTNVEFVGHTNSSGLTGGTSTVALPLDIPYYNENTATVLNSEVKNSLTNTLTTSVITGVSHAGETFLGRLYAPGGITCGGYHNTSYSMSTASFICNSWVRTVGNTGWYSETYQGGIYMSDSTFVQVWNAKRFRVNNALHIHPCEGNYCEGLRIYQYGSWSDILLGGNDLTANTGTSANSWFIGNNNGTLNITRNGSSTGTAYLRCVSNKWYINTTTGSEQLNVGGWVGTTGNTGWYNITHGGGWYMQDSTYIRNYGGKQLYINAQLGLDANLQLWNNTRQILRTSRSVSWISGRDSALIRETDASGYHALACVKTGNGAWCIGNYNTSGWTNYLLFSYTTDANYSSSNNAATTIRFRDSGVVESAMWNDYAEYRQSNCDEPGRVVYETGSDIVEKTFERLQHFAGVVSDTYGYVEGETETAKTPLAVAGRVLVYPYQDRENYQPGDCVCAAPGGTVDIMTREEIIQYPDRIVGTVSCVPQYDSWGVGDPVKVNGRIWIKVH